MYEAFGLLPHPLQALIAGLFTWFVTALGASIVFFFRKISGIFLDAMLGFAAGVMTAASFWSLLEPAIDRAFSLGIDPAPTVALGFMAGGVLLFVCDIIVGKAEKTRKGPQTVKKRSFMLVLSIVIHNIPEGLAVGVAFGALAYGLEGATLASACLLALGIGLQNFPEGTAVSVPLRRDGCSRGKAFFYGQISGIVEPISSVLGALLVISAQSLLPFLLSFAAGAMIYVVVEELIPESQKNENKNTVALFTLVGFTVMMLLDISFG